jgi:hypothetical protein
VLLMLSETLIKMVRVQDALELTNNYLGPEKEKILMIRGRCFEKLN